MAAKMEYGFLHVRVPAPLLKEAKKIAKGESISLSMLIRQVLLTTIRKKAKK